MGDRTTPMKFGPEWLRNLSREPTTSPGSGAGGGTPTTTPIRPVVIASASNTTTPPNTSKVLLAKLRYGREEMLALYDRQNVEAPPQLKTIDLLYQPRGKPPYALNNNFEDDTRDINMRNNPPIGGISLSERYGQGRGRGGLTIMSEGRGRGTNLGETRGRARGFVRQTSLANDTFRSTSWHNGIPRSYSGAPDDDPNPSRMWNNGVGMTPPGIRPSLADQADWANKAPYRKNRQNHTNWRQQQSRDEGEEWRSSDGAGARRGQEKWEREWPEKSGQEKSWTPNRRQWSGDNNEDALPEWAVENAEACGGTFDSSGAFHGYSNDDSNLPKVQESSHPLARSHTHGNFARSKTAEEGSEEWWASEKAKKLSAKRFDATEVKFKKHITPGISEENANANPNTPTSNSGANTGSGQTRDRQKVETVRSRSASSPSRGYSADMQDEAAALPAKREESKHDDKHKDKIFQTTYSENTQASAQQRIDMLLRAEEIESKDRGNYKSVMMNTNNNHLRQKHQNIVTPTNGTPKRISMLLECAKQRNAMKKSLGDSDDEHQQKQNETKLVEDLLDMNLNEELQAQLVNATTQAAGMSNTISSQGMQMMMNNPLQNMVMSQQKQTLQSSPGMPQGNAMRPIGITNSLLNASLGLPIGTGPNMGMPLPNMPPSSITNPGMLSSSLQGMGNNMQSTMQGMQNSLHQSAMQGMQSGMQGPGMQGPGMQGPGMQGSGMQGNGFQQNNPMPGNMQSGGMNNLQPVSGMSGYQGVGNSSLFMQGSPNTIQNPSELSMHAQQGMYPLHGHGLQQSASQGSFSAAMYGNMIQQPTPGPLPNIPLTEQWYYEDPKKTIQGPFTTKEMCNWYRAGFFSPDLMVRRACESGLRPLITYGVLPFGPMELMHPPYNQLDGRFDMRPQSHNGMINQQGLGPEVESLWSQPSNDMMWVQQPATTPREDNNRMNISMYVWDQPSVMSNSLLPDAKDMKTEDEILAQMRASQAEATQNLTFMSDAISPEDAFTAGTNIAPNLEELQKLIGSDIHASSASRTTAAVEAPPAVSPALQRPALASDKDKKSIPDPIPEVSAKPQYSSKAVETKTVKQPTKLEEKPAKAKDVTVTKAKTKKTKDDKKDDTTETKLKDDDKKNAEKRSEEPSPPKNKKEDKVNKKELEKEKKEWLKDGFTIVKGAEKKDNKKKEKEEARAAEEAEKKRKEEEKRVLLEAEKNRAPEPVTRRQQMQEIGQTQRQTAAVELAPKKAPWSAPAAGRDGLALSDIQRLEREKKLEQMKEQQQMMQVIAQQQAAAAQREQQEMQAGQLGWAKKKQTNNSPPGQTLAEIQAEARLQAAATAAAASAAAREEVQPTPPPPGNVTPWGATNGGGFWDSPSSTERAAPTEAVRSEPKPADSKPKKRVTVQAPRKEPSAAADFETWCTNVLSNWRDAANIDIPTFVAFLKDIESPYEVKDYVKCYLGDTKESNDFARQFLERRSRMLRVGMVTPSDDLCSPAAAINPRTNSGSDYTEVKSKTKKNKMFKVDARILGFSVTASEDRINIGDIDTV